MPETELAMDAKTVSYKRENEFLRLVKQMLSRPLVAFGTIVILLFILISIFAPFLTKHDPHAINLTNTFAGPSRENLLGTDDLGRDLLTRIIYGARTSLVIGLLAVGSGSIVGMVLGLIAGYFGGWINLIIMRFMDAFMAFPQMLLAMLIASLLGGGLINLVIALSIGLVPSYTRLMCGQVLTIKENDYILAAEAMGVSKFRILFRHLFVNSFPPLIVLMTMMLGTTILAESGLSFLGIGIKPPAVTWGLMISEGRNYLTLYPLFTFAPGICTMLVVFAFNMVGDGLRDALDPRLRGLL